MAIFMARLVISYTVYRFLFASKVIDCDWRWSVMMIQNDLNCKDVIIKYDLSLNAKAPIPKYRLLPSNLT